MKTGGKLPVRFRRAPGTSWSPALPSSTRFPTAHASIAAGKSGTSTRSAQAPADRRHRSHLGLRLRARLGHSPTRATCSRRSPRSGSSARRSRPASRARHRRRRLSPGARPSRRSPAGRSMLVRRTDRWPSSASREGTSRDPAGRTISSTGRVCGNSAGPARADRLPEPIFTPATKAATGHDENISERKAAALVARLASSRRPDARDLRPRRRLRRHAGIIIADTKFEFGLVAARAPSI